MIKRYSHKTALNSPWYRASDHYRGWSPTVLPGMATSQVPGSQSGQLVFREAVGKETTAEGPQRAGQSEGVSKGFGSGTKQHEARQGSLAVVKGTEGRISRWEAWEKPSLSFPPRTRENLVLQEVGSQAGNYSAAAAWSELQLRSPRQARPSFRMPNCLTPLPKLTGTHWSNALWPGRQK